MRDLEFARQHTKLPITLSLPGPYSMARQTRNVEDFGLEKLANAYAEVLNAEIKLLQRRGAAIVRIEESQILANREDFNFFKKVMERLASGADETRILLAAWFNDINHLPGYFDLPFGIFSRPCASLPRASPCLADATWRNSRRPLYRRVAVLFEYWSGA